jgi:hypothetical protein
MPDQCLSASCGTPLLRVRYLGYSMAALTGSFLPPIGQITNGLVKGRSGWPIRVLRLS